MNELLEKLSSYNIFNYLLPGVLFAALGSQLTPHSFLVDNIVVGVFVYYFYGVVISRIGSIIIEPVLRWFHVVRFSTYSDFIFASSRDKSIELLSETNNMYRSLASAFGCLLTLQLFDYLGNKIPTLQDYSSIIGVVALFILFVLSYRKQCNYISARISHVLDANNEHYRRNSDE